MDYCSGCRRRTTMSTSYSQSTPHPRNNSDFHHWSVFSQFANSLYIMLLFLSSMSTLFWVIRARCPPRWTVTTLCCCTNDLRVSCIWVVLTGCLPRLTVGTCHWFCSVLRNCVESLGPIFARRGRSQQHIGLLLIHLWSLFSIMEVLDAGRQHLTSFSSTPVTRVTSGFNRHSGFSPEDNGRDVIWGYSLHRVDSVLNHWGGFSPKKSRCTILVHSLPPGTFSFKSFGLIIDSQHFPHCISEEKTLCCEKIQNFCNTNVACTCPGVDSVFL